jgi:hypothetical protein
MAKLEQEKADAFAELQKLLAEKDPSSKARRMLADLLAKRRKQLRKEIENERKEFENFMEEIVFKINELNSMIQDIVNSSEKSDQRSYQLTRVYAMWTRFAAGNFNIVTKSKGMLEDDNISKAIARAIAAQEINYKLYKKEREITSNTFNSIYQIIRFFDNTIVPLISRCEAHISSKLPLYIESIKNYLAPNEINQDNQLNQRTRLAA